MTLNEIKQTILTYFLAQWALLAVSPVVTVENEDFSPLKEGGDEWVRLSVVEHDTRQRSLGKIGSRKFERLASVFVQVYTKQGKGGTERADEIAQNVRDILEGTKGVTGACFFTGRIIAQEPDEYWHRVVTEIEFSYDETK